MTDGIIRNVMGAIVGVKVLETGMKMINKQKVKIKGVTSYDKKKKKRFY